MKIAMASDHGGFALKQKLFKQLLEEGHSVRDFGCFSKESVDYPDFAFPAAEAVANGECERAILICTTGIGMCMCADKVKGVRCALCTSTFMAEKTRRHNDTNALAIGAATVSEPEAQEIVSVWLNTAFEGGRHARRVDKVSKYEQSH